MTVIAAHPNADGIRETLRRLQNSAADAIDFSKQPAYAEGWNRTMDMLTSGAPPVD
jgi:hypothetical protein